MRLPEVRLLAEKYARQYNPRNVAPFPYQNISQDKGNIQVAFTKLEDDKISGAIIYKEDVFTILINASKSATRQHFTLGHELGHYFLHEKILKEEGGVVDGDAVLDGTANMLYRLDDTTATELEREANNFAASLLMPTSLVERAWEANGSVEACAAIFKVSVIAMSIRLTELGLTS